MNEHIPFSIREGYVNPEDLTRRNFENMTDELRTALWNSFYKLLQHLSKNEKIYRLLVENIWSDQFKESLDELAKKPLYISSFDTLKKYVNKEIFYLFKQKFYELRWYKIYDLVEHVAKFLQNQPIKELSKYWHYIINQKLKKHFAPYRLIEEGLVIPVTNETEIKEIENALRNAYGRYNPVYESLKKSLKHLSDKTDPDYANAIKESINALESLANIILGTEGRSLTSIHQKLCSKLSCPKFVEKQIKDLYDWASENPIRHGTGKILAGVGQEEARLVIVQVSSLINYLISKFEKDRRENV